MLSKLLRFWPFGSKKNSGSDFIIERRKQPRFRTTQDFTVDFYRASNKRVRYGNGRNLSLSGLRFATPFYLRKGEKVDLDIKFSKKHGKSFPDLKLKAKIMNFAKPRGASRYRAGCKFIKMDDKAKKQLKAFLDSLDRDIKSENAAVRN